MSYVDVNGARLWVEEEGEGPHPHRVWALAHVAAGVTGMP
jgi:hypothetical protein